jgi:hypothetical protein
MAGVWHDEGENNILDAYFKGTNRPAAWYIGLYTDAVALGESDGLADLTEVSGSGYARQEMDDADWTLSGDHVTGAQQTFTASGGVWSNVYGWFLTDGTNLIASEHFSGGPYTIQDGQSIKITPTITAS